MNSSPSDVCQQCGETVEIFNGDINFSLELHQQSHKKLETIAQVTEDLQYIARYAELTTTELQLETSKPQMIGPVQSASRGYCDVFLECEERVKVLDGDDILSMESHQQSYKREGTIFQDFVKSLSTMQAPKMQHPNYTCPDCKEIIEIHNNDVVFSFKIHSEKHKTQYLGTYPNDQQSNSSDTSRKSNTKVKKKKKPQQSNVLDTLFTTMPPGLQSHRDFILENEIGKAICTICKVNIEPKLSISAHLKTKAHEDNTISLLKNTLPTNLHDMMEFVSFYGSNLYCNLCGCKVDLCSSNIFETIVNIIVHNFSKDHLKKKTDSTTQTDAGLILKSLALVNPLINENKHMISHKLLPQFKCDVCEKNIGYHENENELTKNFVAHFNSVGHNKCVSNKFILDSFKALYPSEKDHNFIVMKNNIFCTICSCTIDDANLDNLILHLKQASLNSPLDSVSKPNQLCIPSTSMFVPAAPPTTKGSSIILEGVPIMQSFPVESTPQKEINLKELLNTLPEQFKTISCIILNDQGQVTCTICKCTIPASTLNLKTHILGNSHKKKDKSQGASNAHPILSQPTKIESVKFDKNNGNKCLDIKELFSLLPSSMQMNIGFVKTCNNNVNQVFCSVCNANISASSKTLQEHFLGSQHTSLLKETLPIKKTPAHITKNVSPKDEDNLLNNIMETDRFIKSFAKFLDKKDLHYMCTLCKSTITRSSDEQIFKENLMSHATGKKHKTTLLTILYEKLELSNPNLANYSTDIKVNGADFYCRLCGCLFPSLTEEKVLIQNITTHLNGKKHLKEKKKLLTPNSAPVSIDMSSSIKFKDTITECFKKLPVTFQDDIQHIKSGPIEGYFSCKLCESTINPCFLKSHLEDGSHVQRKTNSGESFDLITF